MRTRFMPHSPGPLYDPRRRRKSTGLFAAGRQNTPRNPKVSDSTPRVRHLVLSCPDGVRPEEPTEPTETSMSDQFEMRRRLQEVAAYRELCRGVRRSGRGNVFFALLMLVFAYLAWDAGFRPVTIVIFACLAVGE